MNNFKDIVGYEGLYSISKDGEIYSSISGKYMTIHKYKTGYCYVDLYKNKVKKKHLVHRLVLLTFKGASDKDVNHKDGDKANNGLGNLEYMTRSENSRHAYATGLINQKGNRNNSRKINACQAAEIRDRYAKGETQQVLSAYYEIDQSNISKIVNGKSWT